MPSHSAKSAARDPFFASILAVLWILLAFFVLYPLLRLFLRAFTTDSGAFSLQPLLKVLGNPDNVHAFGNSLLLAAVIRDLAEPARFSSWSLLAPPPNDRHA